MSATSKRLDVALVARGLASGREKAKELITAGFITVNGQVVTKASRAVLDTDTIDCTSILHRYVGRGGEKLEKILTTTTLDPSHQICIDIGASTGGFTDCLLQNGASLVYALDVGHDQLHPSLQNNPCVINMEGTDIRHTDTVLSVMGENLPTLGVVDVSFISLTSIWTAVEKIMAKNAIMVCLIKPQFEAGRSAVGKKGVVKDPKVHASVLQSMSLFWQEAGWSMTHLTYSPITGGEGNIEYLAVLSRTGDKDIWLGDIKALVAEAHSNLHS